MAIGILAVVNLGLLIWMWMLWSRVHRMGVMVQKVADVVSRAGPDMGRKIEENSTGFIFNEPAWNDLTDDYSEGKDWAV